MQSRRICHNAVFFKIVTVYLRTIEDTIPMAEFNGVEISETALQVALSWDQLPPDAKALIWSIVNSHLNDNLERRQQDIEPVEERRRYGGKK